MSISIRSLMKKQPPESLICETVPRDRNDRCTGEKKNERIYRKTSRLAGGPFL